jgi:hypothetical protein
MMQTVDPLNNGQPNNCAFGVSVSPYRGEKRVSHGGSIGGYRSFACTFPDKQLEIVILTNFSSSGATGKVNEIADIMLNKPAEQPSRFELKAVKIDPSEFDKFTGTYDLEGNPDAQIDVFREKNKFYLRVTGRGRIELSAAGQSVFFNKRQQVKITFDEPGQKRHIILMSGRKYSCKKNVKFVPIKKDLSEFTGNYWSPELNTQYSFAVKDGNLVGYQTRHGEFRLIIFKKDIYLSRSFLNKIVVARDKEGRITGIYVTNGRARNVWFQRQRQ